MATFRPCRELYRPRPARNAKNNETFSTNESSTDKKRIESRLLSVIEPITITTTSGGETQKVSKAKTIQHVMAIIDEFRESEDKDLLLDSLDSSKFLSMIQMMKVVRIIYHKAMESSSNAYSMTWLSFLIQEKDRSRVFLQSLLTCCREWFTENETGKKNKSRSSDYWENFIVFLRELYMSLQSKRASVPDDDSIAVQLQKQSQSLANLILDASLHLINLKTMTNSPSFDHHMEIILSTLRCVGVYLEKDNDWKTSQLLSNFRLLLLSDKDMSSVSKKNLMEGIEYRASGWMFNQNQQVYYFPYTKK